jgi:uncharacterized OsmC-like protein
MAMPELIPWQGEPESARLLVVFSGTRAQFRAGLSAWLRHRGSLDLFGASLPSETKLPWPAGKETWLLSVGTLPDYGMLGWWLRRAPEWSVFYQPDNGNGDNAQDYAELGGCFLPWGFTRAQQKPDFIEPAVLWHASGKLRLPEELGNAFDEFDKKEALDFAARAAAAAKSDGGPVPETDCFELRLADAVDREPSNPRSELDRLRKKIREMEEQAETLDWLARDQAPDVFLWVYLELDSALFGVGTHWDLRNWFLSASAEAVAEFTHARIEVKGLGKLHILRPEELSRPVRSAPPEPAWKLRLDKAWRREGSKVFVPEGLELRPAPPLRNPHVVNLLREALWQDCDPGAEILLLVRDKNRDFRFSVRAQEFQKLSTRVDELNRHVALETLRRGQAGPNPMELVLASIRAQLEDRLKAHTDRMMTLLDDTWIRQKADIDVERERVTQAELNMYAIHASSEEIRRLHSEIAALGAKEWEVWTKVVSGILHADRGLLPAERGDLREWLRRLDELRADMADWWRPGRDEAARGEVARRLFELANEVRR